MKFILFCALLGLQFVDFALTVYGLRHGARERNPLLVRLFSLIGVEWGIVATKAILIGLVTWQYANIPTWTMTAFTAVYIFIAANNVSVIVQLRKTEGLTK